MTNRGTGFICGWPEPPPDSWSLNPGGRTAEQPGRHDDLDAHGPGTVIPLTGKAAVRVDAYEDVGRLRSQCDLSATTVEGASTDKRIDIAQDPADQSSNTERGEG
jgi:hypothetical protein